MWITDLVLAYVLNKIQTHNISSLGGHYSKRRNVVLVSGAHVDSEVRFEFSDSVLCLKNISIQFDENSNANSNGLIFASDSSCPLLCLLICVENA